jgi:hypothetical protein
VRRVDAGLLRDERDAARDDDAGDARDDLLGEDRGDGRRLARDHAHDQHEDRRDGGLQREAELLLLRERGGRVGLRGRHLGDLRPRRRERRRRG